MQKLSVIEGGRKDDMPRVSRAQLSLIVNAAKADISELLYEPGIEENIAILEMAWDRWGMIENHANSYSFFQNSYVKNVEEPLTPRERHILNKFDITYIDFEGNRVLSTKGISLYTYYLEFKDNIEKYDLNGILSYDYWLGKGFNHNQSHFLMAIAKKYAGLRYFPDPSKNSLLKSIH